MLAPRIVLGVVVAVLGSGMTRGGEPRTIAGRVVDAEGRPVAGAAVGSFWRGNGPVRRPDGQPYDATRPDQARALWGNVGAMEPQSPYPPVLTGADGRFTIPEPDPQFSLMAKDPARATGGYVTIPPPGSTDPIEIRLTPLVTLRGSFEGPKPGQVPDWTHVYIQRPDDPTRPLGSTRLVSCGSYEARFEVKLPPGSYWIQGYSQADDPDRNEGVLPKLLPITLDGKSAVVDLGRLRLEPPAPGYREFRARSEAGHAWADHAGLVGKPAPRWNVDEAKGVGKDVQPADYRGRWLVVYFWGNGCRYCLSEGLPELVRFHDEHAAQRDRFAIVNVFLDAEGEFRTMAEVDRRHASVVRHVWGGRDLPFPTLLDTTFQTTERYGLEGLGITVLIDPEGRVAEGDLATLAAKLKGEPARPRPSDARK